MALIDEDELEEGTCCIPLTRGKYTLVDVETAEKYRGQRKKGRAQ